MDMQENDELVMETLTKEDFITVLERFQRLNSKKEYINCLLNYSDFLDVKNGTNAALEVLTGAFNIYPDEYEVLTRMGQLHLRNKQLLLAKSCFERAYLLNGNCLMAEMNFNAWKETAVEQWHFKMLNDKKRNFAYNEAIKKTMDENCEVLDIGAGCGLLTLFAASEENCKNVISIEENEVQYQLASKIINRNENKHKITQINTNSCQLNNIKANLLVTEIFDTAFFGEHFLTTIIHAIENLLTENHKIIPCKAVIYLTGVESNTLKSKHLLLPKNNLFKLSNEFLISQQQNEPYDAEYVKDINDIIYLTNTESITVDLTDLECLKKLLFNTKNDIDFTIIKNGNLHAFLVYFDLFLTEDIVITTNPNSKDCLTCWEQAIIYIDYNINVNIGNMIKTNCSCIENKLKLTVNDPNYTISKELILLEQFDVSFLNDNAISFALKQVLNLLKNYVREKVILDMSTTSILGILLCKYASSCFVNKLVDEEFIGHLTDCNKIDFDKIALVENLDGESLSTIGKFVDVLIVEPILKNGSLNSNLLKSYNSFLKCLKPNGFTIPQKVNLVFQIIQSDFLENTAYVKDDNLCGINASDIINEYVVPEFCDINTKVGHIKKLSEPVFGHSILISENEIINYTKDCKITNNGRAIGILFWYNINLYENIQIETINTDYFNCSINFIKDIQYVEIGDVVKVKIKQQNGLLKLYL